MKNFRLLYSLLAALLMGFVFTQCNKNTPDVAPVEQDRSNMLARARVISVPDECVKECPLTAGQNIIVGKTEIYNDDKNLYVTLTTTGEWYIKKSHLYAGDCSKVPMTKNEDKDIPVPGQFPDHSELSGLVQTYTFTIPLEGLPECYCVFAHANVVKIVDGKEVQGETAWGGCTSNGESDFTGPRWFFYTTYCTDKCEPKDEECKDLNLRTQTQGGWGTTPKGNNPGAYLKNNFKSCFGDKLVVGCPTGGYSLTFTSSKAIDDFLPQGSTPAPLRMSYTDPKAKLNVFAGQVVALKITVSFDNCNANFAPGGPLKDKVLTTGPFAGKTVAFVLEEAEKALGGCGSTDVFLLNETVSMINESYVDGKYQGTCILK